MATPNALSKYDGREFKNYTMKMVCHDNIRDYNFDKNGNIWFATQRGVTKFDGDSCNLHMMKKNGLTPKRATNGLMFAILVRNGKLFMDIW